MADPHGQATFYHYRLIKKIQFSKSLLILYLSLPWLAAAAGTLWVSPYILLYMFIAFPLMLWIQYVIGHTVLVLLGTGYRKRWRFRLRLPWLGYIPDQHVSRRVFMLVQFYTCWVGIVLSAIMAFWSSLPFAIAIVFWHLWLLLPRGYTMLRLSGQRKDGMLKMNEQDISYYQQ
ncbi:hypothetical protein [Paenibacillus sp. Y412MC10]|uniref:hypothetical protein n=1 Tax=Geobacillus sp. (strain Y412MC10) TaxID=481743 RepID=UPI0001788F03|nr:hypothetical protein [Paenibacillus sp. Y412MC10]ACX62321.1 hypothetical protein GYMC10_0011 [Paenibacillus sp. Y412MC10]